jgi:hypothetical protein
MPSSTLLQLVARGRQDAYLTGSPQTTFFKQVYRRYTPFAIESIPIEFDGTPDFGRRISTIIPRKAELLSSLFLEVELPPLPQPEDLAPVYWVNDIGHALIEDVSIEIGDKEIDKHTGEWLNIWAELTTPADKRDGFNEMVGHWPVYPPATSSFDLARPLRLTIPLRFWFCNSITAALPLIALQAHPVRIIIHLRKFQELWWSASLSSGGGPSPAPCPSIEPVNITRFQMFGDYVFLDKTERQQIATMEHEYLITQLQISPPHSVSAAAASVNIPLIYNHCCKEFVWVIREDRMKPAREWFNYSNTYYGGEVGVYQDDPLNTALIRLDGYDRFYRRDARYFRITQPYQYHTAVPSNYIYLYSFSLHPESDQPSGSLNCSKIDDIILNLTFNTGITSYEKTVSVFAMNYNIFRVVGGLGGIAFIA